MKIMISKDTYVPRANDRKSHSLAYRWAYKNISVQKYKHKILDEEYCMRVVYREVKRIETQTP